jgi:hypothetical protein
MAIRTHLLGKKHVGYAASLNTLTALFGTTGAYDKAEQHYLKSLALQSEVLGKRSHLGFQIQRAEVLVQRLHQVWFASCSFLKLRAEDLHPYREEAFAPRQVPVQRWPLVCSASYSYS